MFRPKNPPVASLTARHERCVSELLMQDRAMHRIALGLSYDGFPWLGWQTQPNGLTVQDQVEKALVQFVGAPVATICAGRTDTGVHALNQVIHIDSPVFREATAWVRGLNSFLPPSIAVQWAHSVSTAFNARFSALSRTYHYIIINTPCASRYGQIVRGGASGLWMSRGCSKQHSAWWGGMTFLVFGLRNVKLPVLSEKWTP